MSLPGHVDAGETVSPSLSSAALLAHAKEYGILYAIAYFVAADLGLLVKVTEVAGGMC